MILSSPEGRLVQRDIENAWASIAPTAAAAAPVSSSAVGDVPDGNTPVTAALLRDRLRQQLAMVPGETLPAFQAVFDSPHWGAFVEDVRTHLDATASEEALSAWASELASGGATAETLDLVGDLDADRLPTYLLFPLQQRGPLTNALAAIVGTVAAGVIFVGCVVTAPACGGIGLLVAGLGFAGASLATVALLVDALSESAAGCKLSISQFLVGSQVNTASSLVCRVSHQFLGIELRHQIDFVETWRSTRICQNSTQCTHNYQGFLRSGDHVYESFATGVIDQLYTEPAYSGAYTWRG